MEKLTNGERLVYNLIVSLYRKSKTCYANNRWFLNNTNYKNKETISKVISSLCKKGMIEIEYRQEKRHIIPIIKGDDLEVKGDDLEVNGDDLEVNGGGPGSQWGDDLEVKGDGLGSHTYYNILNTIINNYNKNLNFSFFEKVETFDKYGISFDNYCYAIIEYGINNIYIRQADRKAGGAGLAIILNNNFIAAIKKETGLELIDTWLSEYLVLDQTQKNEFCLNIQNRKLKLINCNSNTILLNVIKKCKEKN